MKAKIIRQWIWSSVDSAMRDFELDEPGDRQILLILIEDKGLVITSDGRDVSACRLTPGTKYEVVAETDVPDWLVRLAEHVVEANKELRMHQRPIAELLSPFQQRAVVVDES